MDWIHWPHSVTVLSVNGFPAPMANEQPARCRHTLGRYRTGGVRPSLRDETFLSTVFSLSIDVVTTVFSLLYCHYRILTTALSLPHSHYGPTLPPLACCSRRERATMTGASLARTAWMTCRIVNLLENRLHENRVKTLKPCHSEYRYARSGRKTKV